MDLGILAAVIPFLGTVIGAGMVLGLRVGSEGIQRGMNGFAAGAMCAAAFWNLLLPGASDSVSGAVMGFLLGLGLVQAAEELGNRSGRQLHPAAVMMLAVILHNIPEGMAVGITGSGQPGTMIGIAVQNIPDGAVVAVPLAAMGMKKGSAFLLGVLSGTVEPVAALGAAVLREQVAGLSSGLLGFAAGAMMYVVVRELVPRMGEGKWGMVWYALGMGMILMIS